jgi:hypothetical protein
MEISNLKPRIILLDCDVISHFIASFALSDLPGILAPHQCAVLEYVYWEVACMAVALHHHNVVASSNFRDVAPYCDKNNIPYLGTLDILSIAVAKDLYDEKKCDDFIQTALHFNKAKFPKGITAMRFYSPKDLSFL